jgi:hypothetical protein
LLLFFDVNDARIANRRFRYSHHPQDRQAALFHPLKANERISHEDAEDHHLGEVHDHVDIEGEDHEGELSGAVRAREVLEQHEISNDNEDTFLVDSDRAETAGKLTGRWRPVRGADEGEDDDEPIDDEEDDDDEDEEETNTGSSSLIFCLISCSRWILIPVLVQSRR